ncbi:tRNA lysidine(34) synthetase TilS [Anaerolineales bacterium HSG24]|nr:tRNA lysidine(34) synthetase TilS [Anaerolineales bacterium HSG24]
MNSVIQQIAEFCRNNDLLAASDTIVVGVSGGADSLCLLHVLLTIRTTIPLTLIVAHLNHQLRGTESEKDELFVKDIAAQWQLPIVVERHNISQIATYNKQSIEEASRYTRYQFLGRVAQQVDASKIAVGHHADDQVETVLMHLIRGSGLSGLRGMLPLTSLDDFANSHIIRPLLTISRQDITLYCQNEGLTPREDVSNQDTTFFRNRIRHALIPELKRYNPAIQKNIRHTSQIVTAEVDFLNDAFEQYWTRLITKSTASGVIFRRDEWSLLPLAMKRRAIRRAIRTLIHSIKDIGFEHVERAINVVEQGQTGACVTLPKGVTLFVTYHDLIITTLPLTVDFETPYINKGQVIPITLNGVTPLGNTGWQLTAKPITKEDITVTQIKRIYGWEAYLDTETIKHTPLLRSRLPGDRFSPLGLHGRHQKIKTFMVNVKIPASQRDYVPLLVANKQILWVCGYRLAEQAAVTSKTKQLTYLKFNRNSEV